MKISLLGTLIAGSSLAVALPMVSCSSKESVVEPQPIKKIINAGFEWNRWVKAVEYIIAAPEINHFDFRFKQINDYANEKKLQYFYFENEKYSNFDIEFISINLNDRKNPNNFYYVLEVFEEDVFFKIDNIEFKKAKVFIDYDLENSLNSKIRIEKII